MKIYLLLFCIFLSLTAKATESELERLEAAFIHKMIHYVEWPDKRGHFTIGIMGNEPLLRAMELLQDKIFSGRPIKVIEVTHQSQIDSLQILCIGPDHQIKDLDIPGALVISDRKNFESEGVVIQFLQINGKLRFDINKSLALKKGLKINSRLLKLARKVR